MHGEVFHAAATRRSFTAAIAACATLRRLTVHRAYLLRGGEVADGEFVLPRTLEQVHFEMPTHCEIVAAVLSAAVGGGGESSGGGGGWGGGGGEGWGGGGGRGGGGGEVEPGGGAKAWSLARRPAGGARTSRSVTASGGWPQFSELHFPHIVQALKHGLCRIAHLDLSNLMLPGKALVEVLDAIAFAGRKHWTVAPVARPRTLQLKFLSLAGNECEFWETIYDDGPEWGKRTPMLCGAGRVGDALAQAVRAHAATLTHLDIGGLPAVGTGTVTRILPAASSSSSSSCTRIVNTLNPRFWHLTASCDVGALPLSAMGLRFITFWCQALNPGTLSTRVLMLSDCQPVHILLATS